jgi:hypothetical protein
MTEILLKVALNTITLTRIEYEGKTSVYTQISPLKIRGKDEYILIFPGGVDPMETFVELLMLKKEDHRNPLGFANGYLLIYS